MRLTIIARADLTGLGIQSRNWARLLNPNKVVIIDSSPFNGNEQHPEWYKHYNNIIINGFIKNDQIEDILDDTDVLLTFEIPYNYYLFARARERGIKTILQNNWEFTDYLNQPQLPLPDLLVNHSYWNSEKQSELWPNIADYCPTPLFIEDYDDIYEANVARNGKRRFLHIAGRKTHLDRNGTEDLIGAFRFIPKEVDFELVIKTQTAPVGAIDDPRIIIDSSSPLDERDLYRDFDAMILPRRYAGACLPMNEALASGLLVVMTDIDPNNRVLPAPWLVPAQFETSFMARTNIDVYSANRRELAVAIEKLALMGDMELTTYKHTARVIAIKEYSSEEVKYKWDLLIHKLGL